MNQIVSSSAERMRRYRERKRAGIEMASRPIQLFTDELNEMVERGALTPETRNDKTKVAEAIEAILAQWVEI